MKLSNKLLLVLLLTILSFSSFSQIVRMESNLGVIVIELRPDVAPLTVANFLNYVNDGDYNNSYIHRSIPGFIIQGGSLTFADGQSGTVPADAPVVNEFNLSNVRGTIAMAKLEGQPNSATNSWFINVVDNSANLDNQNEGFTVFGTVIAGMDVVDEINQLRTSNSVPITSGTVANGTNLVLFDNIFELGFQTNQGLSGAWYNPETSGQGIFLDVFPKAGEDNVDQAFMGWFTYDTTQPADDATAVVGNAGHRWITGLGDIDRESKSVTFDLSLTKDGLFDNALDVDISAINGSVTMTFADCNNATITYDLIDQELSRTFDVIRIATSTELCERLSIDAARD